MRSISDKMFNWKIVITGSILAVVLYWIFILIFETILGTNVRIRWDIIAFLLATIYVGYAVGEYYAIIGAIYGTIVGVIAGILVFIILGAIHGFFVFSVITSIMFAIIYGIIGAIGGIIGGFITNWKSSKEEKDIS